MKVTIKQSNDTRYEVSIEPSDSVLKLKEIIKTQSGGNIEVQDQRLIYSGKVLKDDQSIEQTGLKEGHTIHLVVAKKTSNTTTSNTTTASTATANTGTSNTRTATATPMAQGGMNPFALFNNPMQQQQPMTGNGGGNADPFAQFIQSSIAQNPQMLEQMLMSHPMTQQMGMSPDAIRQVVNDPMFRQMLANPALIQQAMAMQGRQADMFQQAGADANTQSGLPPLGMPFMNPFMFSGASPNTTTANTPASAHQQQQQPPEVRFANQLQQLQEMGFYDAQRNLQALLLCGGNVNAAIEYLFANPQ